MQEEIVAPNEEDKKVTSNPIAVTEGQMAPKDHKELSSIIAHIANGGGFPERFDTHAKRIAAYNMAHSLMGARWQLCLNNIAIIQGQMTIYGELPSALAEQTKEVEEKEVFAVTKDLTKICIANKNISEEAFAGVCIIQRKGRSKKEFTYTLDEARTAGQYPPTKWDRNSKQRVPNPDSPWEKFTKVMLMRKAMAMAVKFEFADAMVGVPVSEFDFDLAPDIKDVTPTIDRADSLNARFSKGGSNECNSIRPSGTDNSKPGNSEAG